MTERHLLASTAIGIVPLVFVPDDRVPPGMVRVTRPDGSRYTVPMPWDRIVVADQVGDYAVEWTEA